MTAGALYQLTLTGTAAMSYFVFNPSISHFKTVHKRHTPYSRAMLEVTPITGTNPISFNQSTQIRFNIPRNATLVKDMYLRLELPDIYSRDGAQFQWIKRLGEYLIESVSVNIDSTNNLDTHYSEWLHIWHELNLDDSKKSGYYQMIGNTIDMYDPANVNGAGGIYPEFGTVPSIQGRTLYIPLIFWFNQTASLSYPLIAAQGATFQMIFNIRPLNQLYTVVDTTTGYRIRPTGTHSIGKYLKTTDASKTDLNVNWTLECNYIFLGNEEQAQIARKPVSEYLINQVQRFETTTSTNVLTQELSFTRPVYQLIVIARRTDLEDVNDWSNFTNWTHPDISPFALNYLNPYGIQPVINGANLDYYRSRDIIKGGRFDIQGNQIISGTGYEYLSANESDTYSVIGDLAKSSNYFKLIEPYMTSRAIPRTNGILEYSFSLDNSLIQPSGEIDFSNSGNKTLYVNLAPIYNNNAYTSTVATPKTYQYRIMVFAVNYQFIEFIGGMVGQKWAN